MERESFVFYRSFYEALNKLKPRQRQKALDAIIKYALDGVETPLEDAASVLFVAIKPQLDANNKRYSISKQGGRKAPAKMEEELEEKPQDDCAQFVHNNKPSVSKNKTDGSSKKEPNVNENENENVNENENENENADADACAASKRISSETHIDTDEKVKICFSDFWQAYPKHIGQRQAEIEWARLCPNDQTAKQILDGVNRWIMSRQWQQDDGKYIPYPASFLQNERWKDVDAVNVDVVSERLTRASFDIGAFDRYTLGLGTGAESGEVVGACDMSNKAAEAQTRARSGTSG